MKRKQNAKSFACSPKRIFVHATFPCLFVSILIVWMRSFADGRKIREAFIIWGCILPSSTIGRVTYVHISVLRQAVWDDRIDFPIICNRWSKSVSNNWANNKWRTNNIWSKLSTVANNNERWWYGNDTDTTQSTQFSIRRKPFECWKFY